MTRLRGIRGAVSVEADSEEAILAATGGLLREILDRNGLEREDVVSIVFTATPDLRSAFPAAAARAIGLGRVPVLSAAEIDVEGALPRVVRALLHAYTERSDVVHVYQGEAASLREDLA
ncbi:MAG TPA: chorismate mutase [Actinomycetota bacterium]